MNLGRIGQLVELGALETGEMPRTKARPAKSGPITINQEILRAVGLVSTLNKPLKILGQGEVSTPLFVVADAFSKSAVAKIEAAGGSVQVLEVPASPTAALIGRPVDTTTATAPNRPKAAATPAQAPSERPGAPASTESAAPETLADVADAEKPEKREKPARASKAAKPTQPTRAAKTSATAAEAPAAEEPSSNEPPKRPRRRASGDDGGAA